MRTAKVTLTSTILAAALGLALGLAAAPAMADQPDGDGMHGPHGDQESERGTVEVEIQDLSGTGEPGFQSCLGASGENYPDKLAAIFNNGCNVPVPDDFLSCPSDCLSLFSVEVRTKGSGVTDLRLYFTTNEDWIIGEINDVWVSDLIPAVRLEVNGGIVLTPDTGFT